MPNRFTRGSISSCVLLLAGCFQLATAQEQGIPYDVTKVDRYSTGQIHGRDAYQFLSRGDFDREPMLEIAPASRMTKLPPVQVIDPSEPPPVREVVVEPQVEIVLRGEDRVFDQIRLDVAVQRCVFERVCTDEVKALPGAYLGDDISAESLMSGQDEGFEVIMDTGTDQAPGLEVRGPGRTFIEAPAEPELIQLPDPDE